MRETVVMYRSLRDATKELPKEIRAEVYDAVMDYAFDGVEPELTGVAKAMFLIVKPLIDKNNQRYENGCKGGRPKSNQTETKTKPKNNQNETKVKPNDNDNVNVNDNVNEKEMIKEKVAIAPRFTKPTLKDVQSYVDEQNLAMDSQSFVDFYESKGWKVGREPMKDWKAAARNWARREKHNTIQVKNESVFEHNMRMMREMEAENANENLF